ncbi:MAG: class I SAM-dependent methyltransferase [Candidatus Hodarchaeota archaeon]
MSFRKSSKVPTKESFSGENAEEYSEARWMERIQKATTRRALELLEDPKIGGSIPSRERSSGLILDLGCGNGFSSEILHENGYINIVGLEVSLDMLELNYLPFSIVLSDMKYLPFRKNKFSFVVSISAMNFISQEVTDLKSIIRIYNSFSSDLYKILDENGRLVIEFYPKNSDELEIITKAFGKAKSGFSSFLVIDKPKTKKSQNYLISTKV